MTKEDKFARRITRLAKAVVSLAKKRHKREGQMDEKYTLEKVLTAAKERLTEEVGVFVKG